MSRHHLRVVSDNDTPIGHLNRALAAIKEARLMIAAGIPGTADLASAIAGRLHSDEMRLRSLLPVSPSPFGGEAA